MTREKTIERTLHAFDALSSDVEETPVEVAFAGSSESGWTRPNREARSFEAQVAAIVAVRVGDDEPQQVRILARVTS